MTANEDAAPVDLMQNLKDSLMPDSSPTYAKRDLENIGDGILYGDDQERAAIAVAVIAEIRTARASIGPDSERIRCIAAIQAAGEQWPHDGTEHRQAVRSGIAAALNAVQLMPPAAGLLLGPDKVPVDREDVSAAATLLDAVVTYKGFDMALMAKCRDRLAAALSEPQPKPEGTS